MNDYIFTEVITPLVKGLYTEVMVIGMFLVGFGYVRSAMSDPLVVRRGHFCRRIVLLTSVMLFSTYIILSYNVDNTNHVQINCGGKGDRRKFLREVGIPIVIKKI